MFMRLVKAVWFTLWAIPLFFLALGLVVAATIAVGPANASSFLNFLFDPNQTVEDYHAAIRS